jgi:hypothetical protein
MGRQENLVVRDTCWQHEVRLREADAVMPLRLRYAAPDGVCDIPFALAKEFIERYEWLGHIGSAKYCYGLIMHGTVAGVVCYTAPTARNAFANVLPLLDPDRIFQLCRGASAHWAPPYAGSQLISGSLRLISKTHGADLVIAYADPQAGEIGAVYQAANALYLGPTESRGPGKYVIMGKEYHARAVPKKFGTAKHAALLQIDPNYRRYQRTKKLRYVWATGNRKSRKAITSALAHLIRDYPKRGPARG